MTKFIPVSHTALSTWKTCPRHFEAKYILKSVTFTQNAAAARGVLVHTQIEKRITSGMQLPRELDKLTPMMLAIDKLRAAGAEVHAERKLAVDADMRPCAYNAWDDRYMFGIVDCVVVKGANARIFDWKTGKVRPSAQQLHIMSQLVYSHYPALSEIRGALVFLDTGEAPRPYVVDTSRTSCMPDKLLADINSYKAAQKVGLYPPKRSGLCAKYCDVLSCPFNGRSA